MSKLIISNLDVASFRYKKRYWAGYVLIPLFFFLISFFCFRKPHQIVSLATVAMVVSSITLGFLLLAHHCERISKNEIHSLKKHRKATFAMQGIFLFAATFTIAVVSILVLFD